MNPTFYEAWVCDSCDKHYLDKQDAEVCCSEVKA